MRYYEWEWQRDVQRAWQDEGKFGDPPSLVWGIGAVLLAWELAKIAWWFAIMSALLYVLWIMLGPLLLLIF